MAVSEAGKYDLIVLDIMLPGMSGFEVLQHLRSRFDTPVLMLTARGEDVDRIVGVELGADDYLPKPFNPRELIARARAILRRTKDRHDRHTSLSMPKESLWATSNGYGDPCREPSRQADQVDLR